MTRPRGLSLSLTLNSFKLFQKSPTGSTIWGGQTKETTIKQQSKKKERKENEVAAEWKGPQTKFGSRKRPREGQWQAICSSRCSLVPLPPPRPEWPSERVFFFFCVWRLGTAKDSNLLLHLFFFLFFFCPPLPPSYVVQSCSSLPKTTAN